MVQIECRQCGAVIFICRRCWRGQRYCSRTCKKLGYQQRRRKAKRKYRYTENGKKKRIEAERRRRLRILIPSGKKKKDKGASGIRKKKQLLAAKQYNPAPSNVKKIERTKTPKYGKKNNDTKKSTKGSKEACHFCGAEGAIVKKVSLNCEKAYPYFSFKIKRRERTDRNRGDKERVATHVRYYWQME